MTFIITLIALLIERFFDWNQVRHWRWFLRYQSWLAQRCANWSPYVILGVSVGLPVLVVALINGALKGLLFGIFKLIFGAVIVVYCLGPRNFWGQFYTSIVVFNQESKDIEIEKIKTLFGVTVPADVQGAHRAFVSALFIEANRRIFAVLFWYLILGPAGALLYRLVDLSRSNAVRLAPSAEQTELLLNWLPVRLFSFLFALGGHFTQVVRRWKLHLLDQPAANDVMLTECGISALDVLQDNNLPEDGIAEQEALSLLDRVFVIALVILAIVVIV
jgi:AmpE protein